MYSGLLHVAKPVRVTLRRILKFFTAFLVGVVCTPCGTAQGPAKISAQLTYWIVFDNVSQADFKRVPVDDIYLMDENGKHTKQLTKNHHSHNPSWSPDGRQILFLDDERLPKMPDTGDPTYDALLSYWDNLNIPRDVVRMDADGQHVSPIAKIGPDVQAATWLPDGHSVAIRVSNRRDILVTGPQGSFRSGKYAIYDNEMRLKPLSQFVRDFRPFPREQIRYEYGPYESRYTGMGYFLLASPMDNFKPTVFVSSADNFTGRVPDFDSRDRSASIEVVLVDGTPSSSAVQAFDTAWSSDGKHIAYSAFSGDQNSVLYVAELNGDSTSGEPRTLTDQEWDAHGPAWSTDGKHIAFAGLWKDSSQIFTMSMDGTNLVQLSNDPAMSCYHAAWSPDGKWIAADCRPTKSGGLDYRSHGWWMGWFSNIYLFEVDRPGNKPRKLTKCSQSSSSSARACSAHNPSFAPAGTVLRKRG